MEESCLSAAPRLASLSSLSKMLTQLCTKSSVIYHVVPLRLRVVLFELVIVLLLYLIGRMMVGSLRSNLMVVKAARWMRLVVLGLEQRALHSEEMQFLLARQKEQFVFVSAFPVVKELP